MKKNLNYIFSLIFYIIGISLIVIYEKQQQKNYLEIIGSVCVFLGFIFLIIAIIKSIKIHSYNKKIETLSIKEKELKILEKENQLKQTKNSTNCQYCGTLIDEKEKKCPNCGSFIK